MADHDDVSSILLNSEEDAWELLRQLIEKQASFENLPNLKLGEWAKIKVYIQEERYDSALTPVMMNGWVEVQRAVYRTYAVARTGRPDGKSLSDKEKEQLELVVKVKSGSSDQAVDLTAIIETLVKTTVGKLTPDQALILGLTFILSVAGVTAFRTWIASKKEIKLAEIESLKTKSIVDANKEALSTITQVVQADRDRVRLFDDAKRLVPSIVGVQEEAAKSHEALVKFMTKNDVKINDVSVSSSAGQLVTSATRVESVEERLDGLYLIQKVDTTVATGFRVSISNNSGEDFIADVAEVMTTLRDRQVIQDAEWRKVPVYLQINARMRRALVTDAIIVRARPYDPETDGVWRA